MPPFQLPLPAAGLPNDGDRLPPQARAVAAAKARAEIARAAAGIETMQAIGVALDAFQSLKPATAAKPNSNRQPDRLMPLSGSPGPEHSENAKLAKALEATAAATQEVINWFYRNGAEKRNQEMSAAYKAALDLASDLRSGQVNVPGPGPGVCAEAGAAAACAGAGASAQTELQQRNYRVSSGAMRGVYAALARHQEEMGVAPDAEAGLEALATGMPIVDDNEGELRKKESSKSRDAALEFFTKHLRMPGNSADRAVVTPGPSAGAGASAGAAAGAAAGKGPDESGLQMDDLSTQHVDSTMGKKRRLRRVLDHGKFAGPGPNASTGAGAAAAAAASAAANAAIMAPQEQVVENDQAKSTEIRKLVDLFLADN